MCTKICLISLIEDVGCTGLRYLSSYIQSKGHQTILIFLPRLYSEGWDAHESYRYPYPPEVLQQISDICADVDIIGISLMSCHFDNAVHITKYLKKLGKPVIWGGIHPTISPQECLEYADMVCVGEGEHSMVALLNWMEKFSYESASIPGILTQKKREITVSEMVRDLDILGFPDYDLEHQFILYENNIIGLNREILSDCLCKIYRTSFSRGCTGSCTYCCNNVLKRLYGNVPIRWRSPDKQMEELRMVKLIFDPSQIGFADDTFLSRPYEEIKEFSLRYKKEIGVEFRILTTPLSISYDKIKILVDAGLVGIGIGVQSVYEPVRKMYKRHESVEHIRNASEIIKKVSGEASEPIAVRYDFIVDNPWGGEKDVEESIKFAMTLKKPREICIFSLVFYHRTELYERAKSEGIIKDELNEVYRVTQLSPKNTYMNEVFLLLMNGCPNWIIKLLINPKIRSMKVVQIIKYGMYIIWRAKNLNIKHKKTPLAAQFNGVPGEIKI